MILIFSSFVAASPVGGGAQVAALAKLDVEAVLAPTVLFGRHPGLGPPGGAAVASEVFAEVVGGIEAAGTFAHLQVVITGYFASPEQIEIAAAAIDRARKASPGLLVVVDPIMGDADKGLYVGSAVAASLAVHLVPRADLIAPNAWELQRLTGCVVADAKGAAAAAREAGRAVLVSSVPMGRGRIGVLWTDGEEVWVASHRKVADARRGTGDLLTALFTAALADGASGPDALETAVSDVAAEALGEPADIVLERLA
jgi:pyridoxine kinase